MNKKDIKFFFFGTGSFGAKVLEALVENSYAPEIVITAPDKPKGRKLIMTPPPVKAQIINHKLQTVNRIRILQPEKLGDDFIGNLKSEIKNCDLFIVADYGKILPSKIINMSRHKTLNVHPSLLPKLRGASPIQSFVLSGEKNTGVTIMLMDEEMDHGPILAQQELEIQNTKRETRKLKHKNLEQELAQLGGELLVKTIPDWIAGKIKPREQNHAEATYTKKITKEDGLLNIKIGDGGEIITGNGETLSADESENILRKILALTPWPGVYFFLPQTKEPSLPPKRIIVTDAIIVGDKLKILRVKPEGKNEMAWEDFLRGNKL